jgi:hypothetical protein
VIDKAPVPARLRDLEVWWKSHPERWPHVPPGHYIGPDGRLLAPAEFRAYAADPHKLIVVFDGTEGHGNARSGHPAWEAPRPEARLWADRR